MQRAIYSLDGVGRAKSGSQAPLVGIGRLCDAVQPDRVRAAARLISAPTGTPLRFQLGCSVCTANCRCTLSAKNRVTIMSRGCLACIAVRLAPAG